MFEDGLAQNRDIDNWEHGEECNDNGPEKELVGINISSNVADSNWFTGSKTEERSFEMLAFPGENEECPCKECKYCCSRTENGVTGRGIFLVAFFAKVSSANCIHDKSESDQTETTHQGSVHSHVNHQCIGEYALPLAKFETSYIPF